MNAKSILSKCYFVMCVLFISSQRNAIPSNKHKNDVIENGKCNTEQYNQTISVKRCKEIVIQNNYCHGQCVSGYVPKNGVDGLFTCTTCQPLQASIITVKLQCEENKVIATKVEMFGKCGCMSTNCKNMVLISNINDTKKLSKKKIPSSSCRFKCRYCRKSKRKYKDLLKTKRKIEYLKMSCRTKECQKRISDKIFKKTINGKKEMKKYCHRCKVCKKRRKKTKAEYRDRVKY